MITGSTPAATARAMRDEVQRVVACVTVGMLSVQSDAVENKINLTSRMARQRGDSPITLTIKHSFSLIHDAALGTRSPWQARTTGYIYMFESAEGREILAYHWHPFGLSPVTLPHLHLGAGAGALRDELTKAHLETAFVTPVALLQLAIERFGVRPRRADWTAVLERARRALDAL